MICFFENGSRQRKKLIVSDYPEDITDVMEAFFEDHGKRPHVLKTSFESDCLTIRFESGCEGFVVEKVTESEKDDIVRILRGE